MLPWSRARPRRIKQYRTWISLDALHGSTWSRLVSFNEPEESKVKLVSRFDPVKISWSRETHAFQEINIAQPIRFITCNCLVSSWIARLKISPEIQASQSSLLIPQSLRSLRRCNYIICSLNLWSYICSNNGISFTKQSPIMQAICLVEGVAPKTFVARVRRGLSSDDPGAKLHEKAEVPKVFKPSVLKAS